MNRREILKTLTAVAGGSFIPLSAWRVDGQQANQNSGLFAAEPIRGLVKKNDKFLQPIQIRIQCSVSGTKAITKLDGVEIDSRLLTTGENSFPIFSEPVTAAHDANITVSVGELSASSGVKLLPVRKVLIYVLPHSHHDLGYTDIQPHIEEKQMNNISLAIDLARKTANYPEGSRFIWNLEVLWGADLFMQRKSQVERSEFIDAVKKGWVSINGMYANELTGLCRPEELLQLFRYSEKLRKQCGVEVNSAMLSDVPGYTWGTLTAMSQAGIRYFSAAPNNTDRIGTIRLPWHDHPFWHVSPSGKERILVWMPSHGYTSWPAVNAEMAAGCQDFLDSVNFPYEISYVRWSGHGDNAVPDPELPDAIRTWNENYEWPKFVIASTSEAFSAFEKRYGSALPEFKGDLTPYWEDGAGSSALETRINRNSADRLTQAEALAAMLSPSLYSAADFNEAWRNVLLYSEHTWGAAGSVRDPENPMTKQQWAIKRQVALDGEVQSKKLLASILNSASAGSDGSSIDIHNTSSWPRTELVLLSEELSKAGDRVKDASGRPAPSQRLTTGGLAIWVEDIPAFGSKRFHISEGEPATPARHVSVTKESLDNGLVRAKVDSETGNLIEFGLHGASENLIDAADGQGANEYIFIKGKDFAEVWKEQNEAEGLNYLDYAFDGPDIGSILKSGQAQITIDENGPLVASLRIESAAPGCNNLKRRLRLIAGANWLEISNVVDKKPAPDNPHSANDDMGRAWAQFGGKESVHFGFPFALAGSTMHMDIPLGEMNPVTDQIPGACKNWLPVGRWVDVANAHRGVTWVTLDAPLVEIGELSATLVGSQHNPILWRDGIEPTQKLYSWAMNNHWETNYCASQEGLVEFRYALRAHSGYDPAQASRFAIGLSQPLLASFPTNEPPNRSLLKIEPADVLAVAMRPSEDGKAMIVQLFGASGKETRAKLTWADQRSHRVWRSNLSEDSIELLDGEIPMAAWELVTLRTEEDAGHRGM
jgi:alpha-mannosidase